MESNLFEVNTVGQRDIVDSPGGFIRTIRTRKRATKGNTTQPKEKKHNLNFKDNKTPYFFVEG